MYFNTNVSEEIQVPEILDSMVFSLNNNWLCYKNVNLTRYDGKARLYKNEHTNAISADIGYTWYAI